MKFSQALIFMTCVPSVINAAMHGFGSNNQYERGSGGSDAPHEPQDPTLSGQDQTRSARSRRSERRNSAIPGVHDIVQAEFSPPPSVPEDGMLRQIQTVSAHNNVTGTGAKHKCRRSRYSKRPKKSRARQQEVPVLVVNLCPEHKTKITQYLEEKELSLTLPEGDLSIVIVQDETKTDETSSGNCFTNCCDKCTSSVVKTVICPFVSFGYMCGSIADQVEEGCAKCDSQHPPPTKCCPDRNGKCPIIHCWNQDCCVNCRAQTAKDVYSCPRRSWICIKNTIKDAAKDCTAPCRDPTRGCCGKTWGLVKNTMKVLCCPCGSGWYYMCNCGCCGKSSGCPCCCKKKVNEDGKKEPVWDLCAREGPGCCKGCLSGTWSCTKTTAKHTCIGLRNFFVEGSKSVVCCPVNLCKCLIECHDIGCCEMCKRAAGIEEGDTQSQREDKYCCCPFKKCGKFLNCFLCCCQVTNDAGEVLEGVLAILTFCPN